MRINLEKTATLPGFTYTDPSNIEHTAYAGQVDEIYTPTGLNYLKTEEVADNIKGYAHLLSPGGKLIIGGVDVYLLAKEVSARNLTEKEINTLLFYDPKFTSLHSLQIIKTIIQSLGMKINHIYIDKDEVRFTIEAEKI